MAPLPTNDVHIRVRRISHNRPMDEAAAPAGTRRFTRPDHPRHAAGRRAPPRWGDRLPLVRAGLVPDLPRAAHPRRHRLGRRRHHPDHARHRLRAEAGRPDARRARPHGQPGSAPASTRPRSSSSSGSASRSSRSPGTPWDQFWIIFGVVGWALAMLIGIGFVGPELGRIDRAAQEFGPESPEVARRVKRLFTIFRFDTALLVLVVIDMAAKPIVLTRPGLDARAERGTESLRKSLLGNVYPGLRFGVDDQPVEATVSSSLAAQAPGETATVPVVEIVVPVFNEKAQLEPSVRRLHAYLRSFPFTSRITIADNASTDGTWDIACRLRDELDGVACVRLEEKGRGRALHHVWSGSDADVLAYMDVDLSTDLDRASAAGRAAGLRAQRPGDRHAGSPAAPRVVRGRKRELISRVATTAILHIDARAPASATRSAASRRSAPTGRVSCSHSSRTVAGSSTPSCSCSQSVRASGSTRCRSTGSTTRIRASTSSRRHGGPARRLAARSATCAPGQIDLPAAPPSHEPRTSSRRSCVSSRSASRARSRTRCCTSLLPHRA